MAANSALSQSKPQQMPKTLGAFLLYYLRPYRWLLIGMLLTGLYWGINNSLTPYILKIIIDRLVAFDGPTDQIFSSVQWLVLAYILMFCGTAVNFRFLDWLKLKLYPAVRKDIIVSMFSYLKGHSHSFFQNNFAGSLSNKITDMNGSAIAILQRTDEFCAQVASLSVALVVLTLVHPLFACILVVWAIVFIGISVFFTKKVSHLSTDFSRSVTKLIGRIVDSIANVSNTRLFSRFDYEVARIQGSTLSTVSKDRKMQWYILKMRIFQDMAIVFLISAMLISLVLFYQADKVTAGDFALIMMISISIFQSIWYFTSQFAQLYEDIGRCRQALTIVTTEHEIKDNANAHKLEVIKGTIKFESVSFSFQPNKSVFDGLSLTIPGGQKLGLVGYSGSGKSTFVNLILRLFEIQAGRILIDGKDIREVSQSSLRENIATVPQDATLFHRSLMENIRYGAIHASDNEVYDASKKAHCDEFIQVLEQGYDSLVGERGIKLSGGQRQRISIARAMLKNSPILILDEATSALDSVTEKHIQDSLKELMQGRTTIAIAHRLSTLLEMDQIIVFDQGKVIEQGTHQELLDKNNHYAKMWRMQSDGFLPESCLDE